MNDPDIYGRARELRRNRESQSRFGPSQGVAQSKAQGGSGKSRFSRFASSIGNAIPDPVKRGFRFATSGVDMINTLDRYLPSGPLGIEPGTAGTVTQKKLESTPVVGGALATGFDVATAPTTLATAGFGGPIAAAVSKAGTIGKIGGALIRPAVTGSFKKRLFSEIVMGTASLEASEAAAERGLPLPYQILAGAIGGLSGVGIANIAEGAAGTIGRQTAREVGTTLGYDMGNRQFVTGLNPLETMVDEINPRGDFIGKVQAKSGMRPAENIVGDIGKINLAYKMQSERGKEMAGLSTSAALDYHNKGTRIAAGRGGHLFDIDEETGNIKNLVDADEKPLNFHTVFEDPDAPTKYNFTVQQKQYFDDWHQAAQEAREYGIEQGLFTAKDAPDAFHVMRIVRGIDDIELRGKADPFSARMYDTVDEGMAAGLKYENDPKAILHTWIKSIYAGVADKQLNAAMAPHLVTPSSALRKIAAGEKTPKYQPIINRLEEAGKAYKAAVDAKDADAIIKTRKALDSAKGSYKRALEAVEKSDVLPKYVFGRGVGDEKVAVGKWKGKFLEKDADYIKLAEEVNTITGIPNPVKLDLASKTMRDVGNNIRFFSATGDLAAPFIQLLPLMGKNPVLWGKATAKHTQAFFKPQAAAKFLRDNYQDIQLMIKYGVPMGDVETFLATERGLAGKLARTGPGRQTIGRFEAAYDMGVTSGRLLYWKSLFPTWDGTLEELAQVVRNTTGGFDSIAAGVGPSQRAIESTWLAFSPRLMRSTLALVAHAANPTTPVGREAARSLAGLAAVATTFFTAANIGIGMAKGESADEIEKRIEDSMDPLGGRKFMSLDINGQYIGVGGQVRAITQFLAKAIANPSSFASASSLENPLINYYMGRGAVGVRLAGGAAEAATGERVNVLPFDHVDSGPDLAVHALTSFLPFAIQSQREMEDASLIDRLETGALTFAGLNVNEQTPSQQLNSIATERFGKPYGELTGNEQALIDADHADLVERKKTEAARFGGREERLRAAKLESIENDRLTFERGLIIAFQNNQITADDLRTQMKMVQANAAYAKRKELGEVDSKTTDPNKIALSQWYDLYDAAKLPGTDFINWELHEQMESDFLQTLTPDQRRYIEERRTPVHDPLAQEVYFNNEEAIRDSGYWEVVDDVFDDSTSVPSDIPSYRHLVLGIQAAMQEGDRGTARRLGRVKARIDAKVERRRKVLRRRNPDLEAALQLRGYKPVR